MATRLRETQLKWWKETNRYGETRYWSRGSRWYSAYIGHRRYTVHHTDHWPPLAKRLPDWTATISRNQTEHFDQSFNARQWCNQQEMFRRLDIERKWSTGWRKGLCNIKYVLIPGLYLAGFVLMFLMLNWIVAWQSA